MQTKSIKDKAHNWLGRITSVKLSDDGPEDLEVAGFRAV